MSSRSTRPAPPTRARRVLGAPARRDRDADVPADVRRARRLLLGLYLLLGLTVASWLSRLPTVRDELGLSTGRLGTVLLVGALGSLATVLAAGAIATRWGSRRTLVVSSVVYSVATVLLGVGPSVGSVALLVLGVLLMSSSFALGNVPLNVESVVIERRMGRTVVPQFHAAFSVGSVTGSGLGALMAWGEVSLVAHFSVVAVLALAWRLSAIRGAVLDPEPRAAADDEPPTRRGVGLRSALGAWRERRTLLLGVIVMSAALSEGSANNWVAIGVVDGFARTEAIGAVVFGVFVAAMTASRLAGTWAIDRFGPVRVLATSGVLSIAGLGAFGLAPGLGGAVLGVVGWGLGAGLVVPIGMAAASSDPLRAAGRVSVVSAFASVSAITAPPLIGLAAEAVGVRHALLAIVVVMLVGALLARTVRPESAAAAASSPTDDVRVPGGQDGGVPTPRRSTSAAPDRAPALAGRP